MFGGFRIVVDGQDIVGELGSSRKKISLIAYLLLNKDRQISNYELFETLWPEEEITNPESSLKTLVSRVRANLAQWELDRAIATKSGTYRWNESVDTVVDVFTFDKLCTELGNVKDLTTENRQNFEKTLSLYQGDLLPNAVVETWVQAKSAYYHDRFLSLVYHYLSLLENKGRYEDMIRVSRTGLDVDALDSRLNLELMSALLKSGRSKEALAQYNRTTDLHYNYLGVNPSDEILAFYKQLIKIERTSSADITEIRRELREEDENAGAFVCEYAIFKDIYQLHMRNLKRLNTPMFLALVTISSIDKRPVEPLMLDKTMKSLLHIIQGSLRKGDTVSRYSPSQFAVLLPTQSHENGRIAMERVKKSFYRDGSNTSFLLNYRLGPIEMAE
jgi:DNA-binding SARP family transcriptional activator